MLIGQNVNNDIVFRELISFYLYLKQYQTFIVSEYTNTLKHVRKSDLLQGMHGRW